MDQKKITIAIIVLIVVTVVVFFVLKHNPKSGMVATSPTSSQNTVSKEPVKVTTTTVSDVNLPKGFPTDLPVETGTKVLENFNATSEHGLFQATRIFESTKTLNDNFKIYSDYIQSAGWKMLTSVNQNMLKELSASKGKGNLQITISPSASGRTNTVSLTYSEQQ